MTVIERLADLGITIPKPMPPVATYVPVVIAGDLVIVSGQLPAIEGKVAVKGQLGAGVTLDKCVRAAGGGGAGGVEPDFADFAAGRVYCGDAGIFAACYRDEWRVRSGGGGVWGGGKAYAFDHRRGLATAGCGGGG